MDQARDSADDRGPEMDHHRSDRDHRLRPLDHRLQSPDHHASLTHHRRHDWINDALLRTWISRYRTTALSLRTIRLANPPTRVSAGTIGARGMDKTSCKMVSIDPAEVDQRLA